MTLVQIRKQYMPSRKQKDIILRWRLTVRQKWLHCRRMRRLWSADEDDQLKYLVAKHHSKDWGAIADGMRDRSRRQCWERWHHFLHPHLKKTEWSPEEDQEL